MCENRKSEIYSLDFFVLHLLGQIIAAYLSIIKPHHNNISNVISVRRQFWKCLDVMDLHQRNQTQIPDPIFKNP